MIRWISGKGFLSLRSAWKVTRFLLSLYGLCLLLIFYSPLVDYLVRPLWLPTDLRPAPAIVVLTAWVSRDGILNEQAMRRTHMAARLYRQGLSPLVIITSFMRTPIIQPARYARGGGIETTGLGFPISSPMVSTICRPIRCRGDSADSGS